jgi:hypothetical protein
MPEKHERVREKDHEQQTSILGRFFSRPSRDEAFVTDLKTQWAALDSSGRVKFIIGALIGLVLFIGALLLAYFTMSALIG